MKEDQRSEIISWIRRLQNALTIEADNGFRNIKGRDDTFHSFLTREIGSPPFQNLPEESKKMLI